MTDNPEIHYLMLETRDAAGNVDGVLQVPVAVTLDSPIVGGGLAAGISPQRMWWFSDAVMRQARSEADHG